MLGFKASGVRRSTVLHDPIREVKNLTAYPFVCRGLVLCLLRILEPCAPGNQGGGNAEDHRAQPEG